MEDNTSDTPHINGGIASPPTQPLTVNIEPPTPSDPPRDEAAQNSAPSNVTTDVDAATDDPFTPQRTSREPPLPAFASPHLLQLQALNEQHQTALKAQLEAAGVTNADLLANNTAQHGHHYPALLHLDGISNFLPSSSLVIPHSPLNSAPTSADESEAKNGDLSRSISNSSLAAQYYARAAGVDFSDDTFSPQPPFSPSANGSDIKHSPSLNTITFNGPQPQSPSSEMQQAQHLHAANNAQTNTQSPSRPPQQQQPPQQSQQKPNATAAAPKKGFFASLWSKKPAAGTGNSTDDKTKGPNAEEVKIDPIPIYFTRLRRCLTHHEVNVSKLLSERKRAEQQSVEEIGQWINYSISSLASAAATYYHTHIMHLNTLFELEKKFLDNISDHYRLVEEVEKGKESVEKIKSFMLNDKGEVRSQEEINQMFWPPDAAETKALCRSLWETAQNMELTYKEAQKRGIKRDSVNDRRKRLLDWILKSYHSRDVLSVDSFYHHPWDARVQVAFNI